MTKKLFHFINLSISKKRKCFIHYNSTADEQRSLFVMIYQHLKYFDLPQHLISIKKKNFPYIWSITLKTMPKNKIKVPRWYIRTNRLYCLILHVLYRWNCCFFLMKVTHSNMITEICEFNYFLLRKWVTSLLIFLLNKTNVSYHITLLRIILMIHGRNKYNKFH